MKLSPAQRIARYSVTLKKYEADGNVEMIRVQKLLIAAEKAKL